jgi:hypothetical protein
VTDVAPIVSARLELVSMSPALIRALLDRRRAEAATELGLALPGWFPSDDDEFVMRTGRAAIPCSTGL